jgi:hypothetical protein
MEQVLSGITDLAWLAITTQDLFSELVVWSRSSSKRGRLGRIRPHENHPGHFVQERLKFLARKEFEEP